jgi:DNA-binding transcriptional MerR regulator
MSEHPGSIGALARQSGLSVSALRFYDAAGILRPARVDPQTGYRWYDAAQVGTARLIASLRRVQMPLADISAVLAVRHDATRAGELLDRHLGRLEDGLSDARRHLAGARELLTRQEKPMTQMRFFRHELAAAVAAVRFAVSRDPDLPALNGVLFDFDGDTLRLVASDRYRLAVTTVAIRAPHGPAVALIAPMTLVDAAGCADSAVDDELVVRLDGQRISIGPAEADAVDAVFPDYRRLIRTNRARSVAISAHELVDALSSGPVRSLVQEPGHGPHDVSVLVMGGTGTTAVEVISDDHPDAVGVNREFLLEAVAAIGAAQLVLALDGPIGPLALLDPERPENLSLLMPTRLR